MEMKETQELGMVGPVQRTSEVRNWLWVVVERIALKKPTNMVPSVLFRRKRKDTERGVIGIREDTVWARCLDLRIWPSSGKTSPGVWIAVGDEKVLTRFYLTPGEHPLTYISGPDELKAPYGFVYRVHAFFTEHYARCYLEGKNPGKGRDGDS